MLEIRQQWLQHQCQGGGRLLNYSYPGALNRQGRLFDCGRLIDHTVYIIKCRVERIPGISPFLLISMVAEK